MGTPSSMHTRITSCRSMPELLRKLIRRQVIRHSVFLLCFAAMKKPAGRKVAALRRARNIARSLFRGNQRARAPTIAMVSQGYLARMTAATTLETRLAGTRRVPRRRGGRPGTARPRARRLVGELGRGAAGARSSPSRDRGRPPGHAARDALARCDDGRLRSRNRGRARGGKRPSVRSSRATRSAAWSRCGSPGAGRSSFAGCCSSHPPASRRRRVSWRRSCSPRRRSGRVGPLRASATAGPTASGTGAPSSGRGSSPIRSR